MYKIIGTDGKTYGPVSLEQLRLWLSQGRVDSRTHVLVDGARERTILGLLPELAQDFTGPPPAIAAVQTASGSAARTNGFATAGLVCGLLSWIFCCCFPLNLLGLVFSLIGLQQINAHPERHEGRTIAMAGLVISGLNLLWSVGFALLEFALNPPSIVWHIDRFH